VKVFFLLVEKCPTSVEIGDITTCLPFTPPPLYTLLMGVFFSLGENVARTGNCPKPNAKK
jgi:hypothetical protein